MKKLISGLILTLIGSTHLQAQTSISVSVGTTFANINTPAAIPISKPSMRPGIFGGIGYELHIKKDFYFVPEIQYIQMGQVNNPPIGIPNPYSSNNRYPFAFLDLKDNTQLQYLKIPLQLKYQFKISDKWGIYIIGGGYGAYLLAAHQRINGSSIAYAYPSYQQPLSNGEQSFNINNNVTGSFASSDFGIQGGLGISTSQNYGKFILDIQAADGLANIEKEQGFPVPIKAYNYGYIVRVGYFYPLNKKA